MKQTKDESDALKVLLAGTETRFREEHAALVDAINEQKAMIKAQTALLGALCGDVKAMDKKMDNLCSHTGRLAHIEGDVAAILRSVQGIANQTGTVSSFITGLSQYNDDIRLAVEHKANKTRNG